MAQWHYQGFSASGDPAGPSSDKLSCALTRVMANACDHALETELETR